MAFEITVERSFCASHQIRVYDGSMEEPHTHTWRVCVTVCAPALDSLGLVMDFHKLERLLDAIVGPWNGRSLNELPHFVATNPSAENVALRIARLLSLPAGISLGRVEVWETVGNSATYRP